MPSGVALVKGAPQPELGAAFINEMIGPEVQAKLSAVTFSLPTNKGHAGARRHADRHVTVHSRRLEVRRRQPRRLGQALGPRHGDVAQASWLPLIRSWTSPAPRRPSAPPPCWAASTLKVGAGEFVSLLGPPAAARPHSCASSPACSPPTAAAYGSTARISARGRRIGATSAWCSRTMRCFPSHRRRERRVRPESAPSSGRRRRADRCSASSSWCISPTSPAARCAPCRAASSSASRWRARSRSAQAAAARRALLRARPQAARDHADRAAPRCASSARRRCS